MGNTESRCTQLRCPKANTSLSQRAQNGAIKTSHNPPLLLYKVVLPGCFTLLIYIGIRLTYINHTTNRYFITLSGDTCSTTRAVDAPADKGEHLHWEAVGTEHIAAIFEQHTETRKTTHQPAWISRSFFSIVLMYPYNMPVLGTSKYYSPSRQEHGKN